MATVNSTFNISDVRSLYNQLDGLMGGNTGDSGYINSIFGIVGDVEQIVEGDSKQKVTGIFSLVGRLEKLINKFRAKESKQAAKDVSETAKKAEELNAESEDLSVKLEGDFSEIASDIEEHTEIAKDAQELLLETRETIKEKQEEIAAIIKQIEEAQAKLRSEKDPAKQAELLSTIQGLALDMASIGVTFEDATKTVENLSEVIENAVGSIEDATANMTVVVEDGQAQIGQLSQNATDLTGDVTQTAAEVPQNTATATETGALATAAASNVTTATLAPKLQQISADQGSAAAIKLGSIAGNVSRIAQGIGGIVNNTEIISQFSTSIGSALDGFATQIGAWETVLPSVITSLGSLGTITDDVEEITEVVTEDLSNIGYEYKDDKVKKVRGKQVSGNSGTEEPTVLLTPDYKFKTNFGV